jgi:hypothetical protein
MVFQKVNGLKKQEIMVENSPKWLAAVQGEFDPETADTLIDTVNGLLEDDAHEVIRQFASELTLSLRSMRHLAQKVQYDCNTETKALLLFEATDTGSMTLEAFSQSLVDRIAEGKQLADLLAFYAMALSENE